MRIVHWAHSLGEGNGGLEEFVASLSVALNNLGHSVSIVTNRPRDVDQLSLSRYPSAIRLHFIDIDAQEQRETGLSALKENWRTLESLVSKRRPDLIHLHAIGRGDVTLLSALKKRFGVPVVYTAHSPVDAPGLENIFQPIGDLPSAIIAPSNFMRLMIQQYLPRWESRTVTILNGVDDLGPGRNRDDGNQIFASGRHRPEKGFSNLLAAMPIVLDRVPAARLVIAGNGAETPSLQKIARFYGVSDKIEWTGWISRPKAQARAAESSVVAVPSLWNEPFGLVAAEAAMAGRPVVGARVGGLPEIILAGKTGFLYTAGDISNLGMSLAKVLIDSKLRGEMGVAGREHASMNFSMEKNVKSHLELYESVIADWKKEIQFDG